MNKQPTISNIFRINLSWKYRPEIRLKSMLIAMSKSLLISENNMKNKWGHSSRDRKVWFKKNSLFLNKLELIMPIFPTKMNKSKDYLKKSTSILRISWIWEINWHSLNIKMHPLKNKWIIIEISLRLTPSKYRNTMKKSLHFTKRPKKSHFYNKNCSSISKTKNNLPLSG